MIFCLMIRSSLESLFTIRDELFKSVDKAQNVIDEMRTIFSPIQIGKFLIILDSERKKSAKLDESDTGNAWDTIERRLENLVRALLG